MNNRQKFMTEVSILMKEHNLTADWWDFVKFIEQLSDEEDTVQSLREERDMLAYENKNMAEFIKYNDSTLDDTDVGDIATGTPDVWKRYKL